MFRLRGCASQCQVEIRINDVPVWRETGDAAHDFDLAINEWLFQGLNPIDIHLQAAEQGSDFPDQAAFKLKVFHKPARDTVRSLTEIGEISWRPDPRPAYEQAAHSHNDAPIPDENEPLDEPPLLALPGQADRVLGDPVGVAAGLVVAHLERHRPTRERFVVGAREMPVRVHE